MEGSEESKSSKYTCPSTENTNLGVVDSHQLPSKLNNKKMTG